MRKGIVPVIGRAPPPQRPQQPPQQPQEPQRAALDDGTMGMPRLPFDLNTIGINYNFNEANHSFAQIVNNLNTYDLQINIVGANNYTLPSSSYFTINGQRFTVDNGIGDPSAFGQLYKIHNTNNEIFALKLQPFEYEERYNHFNRKVKIPLNLTQQADTLKNLLKEVFIQYLLFETSKYNNHYDCAYAPRVYNVFKLRTQNYSYLCYIQELINGATLKNLLDRSLTSPQYNNYIIQVCRKLERLWALYRFNHCDLHASNIMFKGNPILTDANDIKSVCLIDFGHSRIQIPVGGSYIEIYGESMATASKQGRDLTHLFAYLRAAKKIPTDDLIQRINNRIFERGLYTTLQQINFYNPHHAAITYFNTHDNSNAYPLTILNAYNAAGTYTDTHDNCIPRLENFQPGVQQPPPEQPQPPPQQPPPQQPPPQQPPPQQQQQPSLRQRRREQDQREVYRRPPPPNEYVFDIPVVGPIRINKNDANGYLHFGLFILALGYAYQHIFYGEPNQGGGHKTRKRRYKKLTTYKSNSYSRKAGRMSSTSNHSGGRITRPAAVNVYTPSIPTTYMTKTPFTKTLVNTKKQPQFNISVEIDESNYMDVSKWNPEILQHTPTLSIYEYIRFYLFPQASKKEMKNLLVKLANIPVRHEKIAAIFLEALQTRDFESVFEFAEKYEVKNFEEQIRKQGGDGVFVPDIETIMDIYMEIDHETHAMGVLATLICSSPMNETEWKNIVNSYRSLPKELKYTFVDKCYNMPNI